MARQKTKPIPPQQLANLIEAIAKRVETQNYSFDIQVTISTVEQALARMRQLERLKVVARIALLLGTENGKATSDRYGGYIQKRLAEIPSLDPKADSAALRALAAEVSTTRPAASKK